MWWRVLIWSFGLSLATTGISWAEEQGVITPEELEQAQAEQRNTYHDEEYGFSITKPEEWALYTAHDPQRELRILFSDFSSPDPSGWKLKSRRVAILQFPADTTWVLVNPAVVVAVYETSTDCVRSDCSAETAASSLLLSMQATPDDETRIALGIGSIELNEEKWVKYGAFTKVRLRVGDEKLDIYNEFYIHAVENRYFLVQFVARTADVPSVRNDVDRIIQSITITEPKSTTPGTKTEL